MNRESFGMGLLMGGCVALVVVALYAPVAMPDHTSAQLLREFWPVYVAGVASIVVGGVLGVDA